MGPNNSFKLKLLRYTKGMAGKACHAFGSTTQFGLTQALGRSESLWRCDMRSRIRTLYKRAWFRRLIVIGATLAGVGVVGSKLFGWPVFDLLQPIGVVLALLPAMYVLGWSLLACAWFLLTYPVRLTCNVFILVAERRNSAAGPGEFRARGVVHSLNSVTDWFFSRW